MVLLKDIALLVGKKAEEKMRLIDADLLKRNIAKWLQGGDPQETEMVKLDDIVFSVIMEIEEQPTAYNPGKVVEELAENSSNYKKSYKANGKYTHKTIKAISQIKAIGIVRKGGIG